MARRNGDGPSEAAVRFRKRVAVIVCFGSSLYLLVSATSMLRQVGARADSAREYASSSECMLTDQTGQPFSPKSNSAFTACRLFVPTSVLGSHEVRGFTYFRLKPEERPVVDFHQPSNLVLRRELVHKKTVLLEYWRGNVSALRDQHGNVEPAYGVPDSSSQTNAVGASGVLFFSLLLLALGFAATRLPVGLAVGGGPGRYSLPFITRPAQRWMYAVFATPALAWLVPSLVEAKGQASLTLPRFLQDLSGGVIFAAIVAAFSVFFAAWYLENRIQLTEKGITNHTLFSRRTARYEDVELWTVRNRRRSGKAQYVDIYRRGEKKPIRLELDMQWRRSKEIVQDVLHRRAPNRRPESDDKAAG
jgi:hypothetical protein